MTTSKTTLKMMGLWKIQYVCKRSHKNCDRYSKNAPPSNLEESSDLREREAELEKRRDKADKLLKEKQKLWTGRGDAKPWKQKKKR